jgi:hypothetical protein
VDGELIAPLPLIEELWLPLLEREKEQAANKAALEKRRIFKEGFFTL